MWGNVATLRGVLPRGAEPATRDGKRIVRVLLVAERESAQSDERIARVALVLEPADESSENSDSR